MNPPNLLCRFTTLAIAILFFLRAPVQRESQSQEPFAQVWNIDQLSKAPAARWGKTEGLTQEVYFAGPDYNGKPTNVFAYVGRPKGDGPFPGIVLVHGGGGQAFKEWAKHWADRGYVSIAMDTSGNGPGKKRLPDGGPDQSHAFKFQEFEESEFQKLWTYHAVADVILSHSLLLSLPQVDKNKTAITGISWGGYLTCIVAGVDNRFKAAVPVYGCGFLQDNSVWKDSEIGKLTEGSQKRWIQNFDPGQHIGKTECPILFLNGTNDFAYPLDSYRKTIEQVRPDLVTTAIHLNLRHGHIWTFPIVDRFVDSILLKAKKLIRLGEIRQVKQKAIAKILSSQKPEKAEVLFTFDTGPWQKRKWSVKPATLSKDTVEFELNFAKPVNYFFQVTDSAGNKTSTTYEQFQPNLNHANHAIVATPKLENDFYDWHRRHADALRIKNLIDPKTILIGDSITHMWGGRPLQTDRANGVASWNAALGKSALNLGFGWDRTQNVLWRIQHGELDGLQPELVVVNIGTNNFAGTQNHAACTPKQIAEAVAEVCTEIKRRLPKSKIVLMGVFPRGQKPDHPIRKKIAEVNQLLATSAKRMQIHFLDIASDLLDKQGVLTKEIAGDFLHPSEEGYKIWGNSLEKFLPNSK